MFIPECCRLSMLQIFTSYVCMYIYLFISRNETKILVNHKIKHFLFFGGSGGSSAARIASSNTFFNPFCVSAEHSTYLTARSCLRGSCHCPGRCRSRHSCRSSWERLSPRSSECRSHNHSPLCSYTGRALCPQCSCREGPPGTETSSS